MNLSDKFENFVAAFHSSSGGCRRTCVCGTEFYNPGGGWDWNEDELEDLAKSDATALEYTVETIIMDGKEYVVDCECWRDRAAKLMAAIDAYAPQIAEYLTLEKARKLHEAEISPTVGG